MNLSPRYSPRFEFWRMVYAFVRPVCIVIIGGIGAGLAAFAFETANGEPPYQAGTIAVLVAGIVWATLAAVAVWGIRYPRPVKVDPRTVILYSSVQDTPTPALDYNELPGRGGQSYEATMQRRKPAPEIQMSEPQLARYVMYLLEGDGEVSARGMAHIGTPADTAKVRRWLWRMRWADERNKTAVLHDRGRQALRELLPHLDRWRE